MVFNNQQTTATNQNSPAVPNVITLQSIVEQVLVPLQTAELPELTGINFWAWLNYQQIHGDETALFRQYAQGNHRTFLTNERRKMLNLPSSGPLLGFQDNYMDLIIQTMVDRLEVTGIEGDSDEANQWAADVLADNRFDGMQGDVHQATLGDADSFILVEYDSIKQKLVFNHEPAWDGNNGMLVVYRTATSKYPEAAMKIWRIGPTTRVTAYYPNRIERWIAEQGQQLKPYDDGNQPAVAPWVMRDGSPAGLPVIHFRNRSAIYGNYGRSELVNAIPLQDALNRNLYSMIIASELTAFQIRYGVGFPTPPDITPGMWIEISGSNPLKPEEKVDIGTLEQASLQPYLDIAQYLTNEISKITQTPSPEFGAGDNASGESLKQREIGLIGKLKRFQIKAGNSWEDVMMAAWRAQAAYGKKQPPAVTRFNTQWADAEIRNDSETIADALAILKQLGAGFNEEFLNMIAPVQKWDAAKVADIAKKLADQQAQRTQAALNSMPLFGGGNGANQPPAAGGGSANSNNDNKNGIALPTIKPVPNPAAMPMMKS